jgi:hypothetical protein
MFRVKSEAVSFTGIRASVRQRQGRPNSGKDPLLRDVLSPDLVFLIPSMGITGKNQKLRRRHFEKQNATPAGADISLFETSTSWLR